MAEEIVTRFTADLSDLQAKVKAAASTLEGYTETANEAGNAIGAQAKKTGDLEAKTKGLVAAENALTKSANEATKAVVETGTKGAPAMDKLASSEKKAATEAKNLATAQGQVGKNTEGAGQKLSLFQRISQGISGTFARIRTGVVEFGRGAKAGFQEAIAGVRGLGGGIGAATSSFGTFGSTVLGLLGPIGIGVAAIGSGLLAVARNTDAGQVAIEGFGRTTGLVFDRITGKVTDLFNLLRGDSAVGQVFQKLAEGAEFFIKTLSPIAPLLALLKVTGISDAFAEDVAEGQRLAALYDDLEDKQLAVNEKTAENEIIIRRNLAALRDVTKPIAERLKLADRITAAEKENLALKKVQLFAELAILNAQAKGQLERKGEVEDSLKAEISALRAGLSTLEADSESLLERVSARRNSILDQDQAANDARRAKEKAAADKAFNEEKQRLEKLAQLREQAAKVQEDLERDALRRQTLGEDGAPTLSTQILDVDFRVEDQINAAKENARQQEELAKGNAKELERIAQELADTIALIREQGNAEVGAITSRFYKSEEEKAKEANKKINDALLTDNEKQVAEINLRYDTLLALADEFILDEDALAQKRQALERKRQEELDEIVDKSEEARIKRMEDFAREAADIVSEAVAISVESNADEIRRIEDDYRRQLDALENFTGTEQELQKERLDLKRQRDAEVEKENEKHKNEVINTLLDGLQKQLQIYITEVAIAQIAEGGATGGIAGALLGAAIGAAIGAILSGLFSQLKGAIGGAYHGEESVSGPYTFQGRDPILRRVHPKERIVSAKQNQKHWDPLHAIHTDTFDKWMAANAVFHMPNFDTTAMQDINTYLSTDTGQRMVMSLTLPKGWDRNTVESNDRATKEQKKTNALLSILVEQKQRERSSRTW